MSKLLKSIIIFIPFFVVVYTLLLFIWGSLVPQRPNLVYKLGSYGHMYSRLQDLKTTTDVDVLFLGSSLTYRGYDPRIFQESNIEIFNLGSSAQTPVQAKVLLKRYLERLNPKLIVFEANPLTFSLDGVESSLDLIANDRNDVHSLVMAFRINSIKTYNTLIYGIIRDITQMNQSFKEPCYKDEDQYIKGGFVEKDMKYFGYTKYPAQRWDLKQNQLDDFADNIAWMRNRNIEIILVYPPITKALFNSYTNNDTFDSLMSNYGEYYNFNHLLEMDDSLHYSDSGHLNQKGVELFNIKIIEIIKEGSFIN